MADGLEWFEAAMGAVSKINAEVEDDVLLGARCPKCESSEFVKVSDLYAQSVGRLEDEPDAPRIARDGGMTDREIVAKLGPPSRKSAARLAIVVAIPLAALAFYSYRRFGDMVGELIGIVAMVVTVIVLMTSLRRYSDRHYYQRRRWNSLFMCRRCGQLVSS